MTRDERLERLLADVLADMAPTREPDRLVPEVLRAARRERRWPRWLALMKESPMRLSSRVAVGSPTFRLVTLAAITMALILALGAAAIAGASLLPSPRVALPEPYGPARNGALAYEIEGDIYLSDAAGSKAAPLITGPDIDAGPYFSRDGTHLMFTRGAPGGPQALMIAGADGMDATTVAADTDWADWSPDGTRIAFTHPVDGQLVLSIATTDGSQPVVDLDLGDVVPKDVVIWRPPHGDELLFRGAPSLAEQSKVALYLVGADGSGLQQITPVVPDATAYGSPTISPDGTTVGYWTWGPDDAGKTDGWGHLLDLETGEDRLSHDYGGGFAPFSPDGRWVVGANADHLVVAPVAGDEPARQIGPAFVASAQNDWDFSPDGDTVYLTNGGEGTWFIDVATGDAARTDQLIPNFPTWQRLAD